MYKRKFARLLSVIITLTVIPFNSISTYANDMIAFTEDSILVDDTVENIEDNNSSKIITEDAVDNIDSEDYSTISANTLELSLDTEDDTEIDAIVSEEPIDKDDMSEDSQKENETSDNPPLPGPVIVPSTKYSQAPVYNASGEYEEVQKYNASSSDNTANVIHYPIKIDTSTNLAYEPDWVNWATSQRVLTFIDGTGNIDVAYPSDSKVIIQRYDSRTIELLSSIVLTMPYPLFGCVTCDKDGNYYVTCGKNGTYQEITICICKYNNDGEEINRLELTGEETGSKDGGTAQPFQFGNCDMTINGNVLSVIFARVMFNRHQSNSMVYLDITNMKRLFGHDVYTSHSFDQRVYTTSDGKIIALNHGDAFDRGFRISRISQLSTQPQQWYMFDGDFYTFHFREGTSETTYAQMGGLTETGDVYVFAGSSERKLSLAEKKKVNDRLPVEARDLFIQILKKDFEKYSGAEKYAIAGQTRKAEDKWTKVYLDNPCLHGDEVDYGVIWLTSYDDSHYAANPHVVTLSDDLVGVLWEERTYYDSTNVQVYLTIIKTDGTVVRDAMKVNGCMLAPYTDPIVLNGNICWATKDSYGSALHSLNPSAVEIKKQPYISSTNEDGSLTLSIEALNVSKYLWQRSTDGISWIDIDNGNNKELSGISENTYYRCILKDDLGLSYESEVSLELINGPQYVYSGKEDDTVLSVKGIGISSYEWQRSKDGNEWTAISGDAFSVNGKDTITIFSTDKNRYQYKYRCVVKGLFGKTYTGNETEIRKKLAIVKQPLSPKGDKGEKVSISLEAWGDDVAYQWFQKNQDNSNWSKSSLKGNRTTALTVPINDNTTSYNFKCILTDKYGIKIESDVVCVIEKDSIVLESHELWMQSKPDSTKTLPFRIGGKTYKNDHVVWNSSNPSLVKVVDGVITVAEGLEEKDSAVITVKTSDGVLSDQCTVFVNPLPCVTAPTSSLSSGEVDYGSYAKLYTETINATILYTIDGSEPKLGSDGKPSGTTTIYDSPILIDKDIFLRAIAIKDGYKNSYENNYDYFVEENWGDINGEKLRSVFESIKKVPNDVWIIFGNEADGYTPYYTSSSKTTYRRKYTGSRIMFSSEIKVFYHTSLLWENRDYTVTYKNNVKEASPDSIKPPSVIIKGCGNYSQKSTFLYTIYKSDDQNSPIAGLIPASKVKVAGLNTKILFTGEPISADLLNKADDLKFNGLTLYTIINDNRVDLDNNDYDISFDNNGSVGKHTLTFYLKGKYTGSISKKIYVEKYDIGKDPKSLVRIELGQIQRSKGGIITDVTVYFGDKILKKDIDYRLSIKYDKKIIKNKWPTLTITGLGNYKGKITGELTKEKATMDLLSLYVADVKYKNSPGNFISIPKIMDNGVTVISGKDIEKVTRKDYKYFNADTGEELNPTATVPAGTCVEVRTTVTAKEDSIYNPGSMEIKGYYRVLPNNKNIKNAKVKIINPRRLHFANGKAIDIFEGIDFDVSLNGERIDPSNYEIISIKNNILPGRAYVTIRGKGEYGGQKTFKCKIIKNTLSN